jgi:hypothetical protein
MVNTRVLQARKSQLTVLAFAALAFALILFSQSLFHDDSTAVTASCAGYNGRTSHLAAENLESATESCLQQIPKISISIKNRHYVELQAKRLQSLPGEVLVTTNQDYVPAMIRFSDRVIKGKLRLKGDWVTHIDRTDAWSLRIQLAGDEQILGRRIFSLQLPEMRSYDVDPLYTRMIRMLGMMTVDYRFVDVEFNGQDWGVMMIEDHFTRELMASHQRSESVIGRIDEADMWIQRASSNDFSPYDNAFSNDYLSFNRRQIQSDSRLENLDKIAASLVTAWQEGRLQFEDIIDLEKFLDFIIITEAWGSHHSLRWHNLRFYLNPYTLKLEPVPFDNGEPLVSIRGTHSYARALPPFNSLLSQADVIEKIVQRATVVKQTLLAENNSEALRNYHQFLQSVLTASGWPTTVDLAVFVDNLNYIADYPRLFFSKPKPPMNFSYSSSDRRYHSFAKLSAYDNGDVVISNKMPFDIVLEGGKSIGALGGSPLDTDLPVTLTPTRHFRQASPVRYQSILPEKNNGFQVELKNPKNQQTIVQRQSRHLLYLDKKRHARLSPMDRKPGATPAFVRVQKSRWHIPAGRWQLANPLVVPSGYELVIEAGAQLHMRANTYILSRNAVQIEGTADSPVLLTGSDGEWRGIFILNAPEISHWRHVTLSRLKPFGWREFSLSGALNFYRSPLHFESVIIEDVKAEDALNIVQADFRIDASTIRRTSSDAIDIDFGRGQVTHSSFSHIGGDAIDTSGSQWRGENLTFSGIRDKALSVGEASNADLQNLAISDSGVGIAVKDYSSATLVGATIDNSALASIMVYSKKPEFGGARLLASEIAATGPGRQFFCEVGSLLEVNGDRIEPSRINTKSLYARGVMKK